MPETLPVIRELPLATVHRIAAGEVIEKPSSALKELLENSLDAGATEIEILLFRDGGFQLRDNGHGIRFEDLPILCRRHTTSKIRSFEDLRHIETLGFRGEALCSVSHVAHVTVTTRTGDSSCGYRAVYVDGEMRDAAVPSAALCGTTVCVQGFFARDFLRRAGLRQKEEMTRYLDVIHSYALHSRGVGFVVKREERRTPALWIQRCASQEDRLSRIFGCEALRTGRSVQETFAYPESSPPAQTSPALRLDGWIGIAERLGRTSSVFLFINNRRVMCAALKRAILSLYGSLLPKSLPAVYLSIWLPLTCVDVNVHPTKRDVEFLWRDYVIQTVLSSLRKRLESLIPVRATQVISLERQTVAPLHGSSMPDHSVHEEGRRLIAGHKYVGVAEGRYAFVHFEGGIYMLDMHVLSHDLFCQIFKQPVHCERLEPPLSLSQALQTALMEIPSVPEHDNSARCGSKVSDMQEILVSWRKRLQETFLLEISENGYLMSVPLPFVAYPLNLRRVPYFLATVAKLLTAGVSDTAISTFAEAFAEMFSLRHLFSENCCADMSSFIEHGLLPAMRKDYCPSPAKIADHSIVKLSTISRLCSKCGR